ncbi:MAG: phosphatase PAP2 family protein [Sphingomicrobium sp.]
MIEKLSPARFALVVAMLTALWLAMLLTGAGEIDRAILVNLYAGDYPWVALAGIALTRLGDWTTVVAVTLTGAAWLAWRGQARDALILLVASFSGRALVVLQKAQFARLRPQENIHLVEVHYLSFPSGHSANSMIAYVCLALLIAGDSPRRLWWAGAAVALSVAIGISRVLVGVHWPSDVVGGWSFGMLWTLLVVGLSSGLERRAV